MKEVEECLHARGHAAMTSTHERSFEITKELHLTRRGDCIVAIGATKGATDLSDEFKTAARNDYTKITVLISAGDVEVQACGKGSSKLRFTHPTDLVARRSTYTCGRTLMISSDITAHDFPRRYVHLTRNPNCKITVRLIAEI